jgi:SnoaL-like domain
MAILKSKTGSHRGPKQPNGGRRSFICKTGAVMSAMLASTVAGMSKSGPDHDSGLKGEVDRLSNQIGCLEDANAIRRLHQTYESRLDKGLFEEVVHMFTDQGEVIFNGGVFVGKNKGVRRLYCSHFSQGFIGKKIEPPAGRCARRARLDQLLLYTRTAHPHAAFRHTPAYCSEGDRGFHKRTPGAAEDVRGGNSPSVNGAGWIR